MKKLITAILAISVLATLSTTAFAADVNQGSTNKSSDTAVTFSVAPTYIVTIPTTIELRETKTANVITYTGSDTITTSAIRLDKGENVKIAIASDFIMTSTKNATQSYTVTVDGATSSLVSGGEVARFGTNKAAQSVKLNYLAADPDFAGDYKDTVTFSLSVVEQVVGE